ncbi:MAG: hypothetical protein PVS3B3_18360 [Ktedonobacteraceae bacterium]
MPDRQAAEAVRGRIDWKYLLGWDLMQHLAIATAINLVRLIDWLNGCPLAPTRVSDFERLYKAA